MWNGDIPRPVHVCTRAPGWGYTRTGSGAWPCKGSAQPVPETGEDLGVCMCVEKRRGGVVACCLRLGIHTMIKKRAVVFFILRARECWWGKMLNMYIQHMVQGYLQSEGARVGGVYVAMRPRAARPCGSTGPSSTLETANGTYDVLLKP